MKYSIIVREDNVYLKEYNRMLNPIGVDVHPTILEEYTAYYNSVESKLKLYTVDSELKEIFLNKYNSGITEVIEGVDFHFETYTYFKELIKE